MMTRDRFGLGSLSFGVKLTLSFIALSFAAIAAISTLITTRYNRQVRTALRDKATLYARLVEPQLRPVVAFDDRLTAREVFGPFGADPDVAGLGVYSADGALIEAHGEVPERMTPGQMPQVSEPGTLLVHAPVVSPEGPSGRLVLIVTTSTVDANVSQNIRTAAALGLAALLCSALITMFISRRVTTRLKTISEAVTRVSGGDLDQPEIAPGPADEIGQLTNGFNVMVTQLRRQFAERQLLARTEQERLEAIVATRTSQLEDSREAYRLVAESTNAIPFTYVPARKAFTYVGPQAHKSLGFAPACWADAGFLDTLLPAEQVPLIRERLDATDQPADFELECSAKSADGKGVHLRWVVSPGEAKGEQCLRGLILDVTERHRLETELAQAQKLESVGRLAAGVAHEINTPVQFVNDSIHFLREATVDLLGLIEKLQLLRKSALDGLPLVDAVADAAAAEAAVDLPYLRENVPKAFERSLDGLERVASIVRSMKEFAHPDGKAMTPVDLNRAVETTLTIARAEYKYVADVETHFGDIPRVTCHIGEVNQAVLNIVVNAAHAIGDMMKGTEQKGRISVQTRQEGNDVVLSIGDTGGGIPENIRGRIFDPFFTTKEVGRGTGQGLSIARSIVVDKHKGDISLVSEMDKGTTFFIRLPVDGPPTKFPQAAGRRPG